MPYFAEQNAIYGVAPPKQAEHLRLLTEMNSLSPDVAQPNLSAPDDEAAILRRTLRDMVALSALPAIGVECDVEQSLQNLTGVLHGALRPLAVCVRIVLSNGSRVDAGSACGQSPEPSPSRKVAEWLDAADGEATGMAQIAKFNGKGPVNAVTHPVFFEGRRVGRLVAFYDEGVLPRDDDQVVLQVAANQAALLLHQHKEREETFARRQAEERLRLTEHRFQQLIEALPAAVYTCDAEGKINYYNRRAAELWGREPRLGETDQRFCGAYRLWRADGSLMTHAETPMAAAVINGTSTRNGDVIIERPDGSRSFLSVNVDPLYDASGKRCGAINVFQDTTEQKQTQKKLQQRTEQLSSFLETAALGLHRVGPDGTLLWANAAEMEMLGYSPEEYIGRPVAEFHVDPPAIQDILARLARGEKLHNYQARLRCKDGAIKDVVIDSSVLWEDGKFIHTQCFTRDITRQRAVELELRNSEQRFRSLVNSVEGIVWECAIEGDGFRFTFVSKQAERLLGYPIEQWLVDAGFWREHIHPEDREWAVNYCISETQQQKDHEFEYRMVAADGRIVWLHDMVTVVVENGRPVKSVGVMVDVTERKQVEEALRQSEALFRQLADSMPQIVWAARPDGQVDYYNRKWYELTGMPRGGGGDESWLPVLHPEDQQRTVDSWYESVRTGKDYQIEYRFKWPGAGEYRWQLGRALPVRGADGKIIRWVGTCTDIEDQKRAEEKLEQAVAERTASLQEALAQMEEFSYSVSHDLRGPLRAMQGYCQILLEDAAAQLTADNLSFLHRIARSAERLDRLVQDVLDYTRVNRVNMEMKPVDLEQLIADVLRSYAEEHRSDPAITVHRPILNVLGHEPSLVQCLSNLIGNALKFVPADTAPHVRIWTQPVQNNVRLWVEDNGIGIPPEEQEKVFNIFERSPQASCYSGTGVGLAIVKRAIHRMQGQAGVESEPGKGSRFWIQLPRPQ